MQIGPVHSLSDFTAYVWNLCTENHKHLLWNSGKPSLDVVIITNKWVKSPGAKLENSQRYMD
jgi:hypothetical protein